MCTGGEEILFGFKAFLLVNAILFVELKAFTHSLDDIATVLIAVNNGNDKVGGGRGTSFSIIIYVQIRNIKIKIRRGAPPPKFEH